MCVGDMIIEINGDNTSQITHSEAQQCILEAGNNVTLSILRLVKKILKNILLQIFHLILKSLFKNF